MCGIALTAECIYFVSNPHDLNPLLKATVNSDIYAAAWIGIFVGLALFVLSILGIIGVIKASRTLLLVVSVAKFAFVLLPNWTSAALVSLITLGINQWAKTTFILKMSQMFLLIMAVVSQKVTPVKTHAQETPEPGWGNQWRYSQWRFDWLDPDLALKQCRSTVQSHIAGMWFRSLFLPMPYCFSAIIHYSVLELISNDFCTRH